MGEPYRQSNRQILSARLSVVINSGGWRTAHVVVELKCCNAENAVMGGSGMKAGDKAEVERGGDTFQQKYQHIALHGVTGGHCAVHTLEEQEVREIRVTLKYRKRVARARERLGWLCGKDSSLWQHV